MDRTRNAGTNYFSDEKANGAINNKVFRCLGYLNDHLYLVELVQSENEHRNDNFWFLFNRAVPKIENGGAVL